MPRPSFLQHPLADLAFHRVRPLLDMLHCLVLGLPALALDVLRRPWILLDIKELQRVFFAGVWAYMGPGLDASYAPHKGPLLAQARGVVVEIGSGRGDNLKYYKPNQITRLILIEPNSLMHPALRSAALSAGFPSAEILPFGAEDLEAFTTATGLREGNVDTVVSVLALCGIPQPELVIAALYRQLRKGGRFIFFEHVRSSDSATATFQRRIQALRTLMFDGCCLDRPIDVWILESHEWSAKQVESVPGHSDKNAFDPKRMGWAQK